MAASWRREIYEIGETVKGDAHDFRLIGACLCSYLDGGRRAHGAAAGGAQSSALIVVLSPGRVMWHAPAHRRGVMRKSRRVDGGGKIAQHQTVNVRPARGGRRLGGYGDERHGAEKSSTH